MTSNLPASNIRCNNKKHVKAETKDKGGKSYKPYLSCYFVSLPNLEQ